MKLQPAPLTTQITLENRLTNPWEVWFRNVSTNLVDSCKTQSISAISMIGSPSIFYNISGNQLCINYVASGSSSASFALPYIPNIPGIIFVKSSSGISFVEFGSGQKIIEIPELTDTRITQTIIVEQVNR